MIEWIDQTARWLHLLSGAIAFGALAAITRWNTPSSHRDRIWQSVPWLLGVFIASGMLLISRHTALAMGVTAFSTDLTDLARFVLDTHYGRVGLFRLAVAGLLLGYLVSSKRRSFRLSLLVLGVLQGSLALAGHGAASPAPFLAQTAHGAHVLAAGAWLGGLASLLVMVGVSRSLTEHGLCAGVMRQFSEFALVCMIVIAMSGTVIAALQIQRWPALFGTSYGQSLLIKVSLLVGVLAVAAHLRWRALKTIEAKLAKPIDRHRIVLWLAVELVFALAVMWMAAVLAVTPPAQHEQILWPFAFRFAPQVTWLNPDLRAQFYWGAAVLAAGCAWLLWAWRQFGLHWRDASVGVGVAALGLCIALPALTVPAFPDTYRRSSVPYQAVSIAAGQRLFMQHCVSCHGIDATGNGPLAKGLANPPADLTAPHAGDHTPGDMYWWLTHGIPGGSMPAFAQLDEEDRWDLVNFVHTLANGYQARVIRERIVARRPWLGAPDFNYAASDGSSGSLKDFREQFAVLLVLFGANSGSRLEQLEKLGPSLMKYKVRVLAVATHTDINGTIKTTLPIVTDGGEDIARSYLLLRRTIENSRVGEGGPLPSHMEFLIDRYGYLRGRWLPEDSRPGWHDERKLLSQAEQLAGEPRSKPPPDEHLH